MTPDNLYAAIRAGRFALEAHQERRGFNRPDFQDCLTDLFHWAGVSGLDVEGIARQALRDWHKERHDPR